MVDRKEQDQSLAFHPMGVGSRAGSGGGWRRRGCRPAAHGDESGAANSERNVQHGCASPDRVVLAWALTPLPGGQLDYDLSHQ